MFETTNRYKNKTYSTLFFEHHVIPCTRHITVEVDSDNIASYDSEGHLCDVKYSVVLGKLVVLGKVV